MKREERGNVEGSKEARNSSGMLAKYHIYLSQISSKYS